MDARRTTTTAEIDDQVATSNTLKELNMKIRNMPTKRPQTGPWVKVERAAVTDFHNQRITSEAAFDAIREDCGPPVGNYEYEQMIAENASASTDIRKMIGDEAYLIAERRGFAPGGEESDWLQAEIDVERQLREARGTNTVSLLSLGAVQPVIPDSNE
jgi:hypothetical protein